jgi:dsDNA-binding SOS-regulon protein
MDHDGKNSYGEVLSTTEKDAFEEMIELAETYFNWAQGIQEKVDDAWTEEQESFK